jgi:hypothetical protein
MLTFSVSKLCCTQLEQLAGAQVVEHLPSKWSPEFEFHHHPLKKPTCIDLQYQKFTFICITTIS